MALFYAAINKTGKGFNKSFLAVENWRCTDSNDNVIEKYTVPIYARLKATIQRGW